MKLNKIGKIYGKTFGKGLSGHTVYLLAIEDLLYRDVVMGVEGEGAPQF
jgi:hypothetical protein